MRAWWMLATVLVGCSGKAIVDGTGGGSSSTTSGTTSTTSSTSSGGGAFASCAGPGQCELTWPGCCAGCQTPALDDLVPVATSQAGAFHQAQCPEGGDCPLCEACPNGGLFAYCDAGSCRGADLQDHAFGKCSGDDQCRLRWGTRCWEPCGGPPECGGLVAVNTASEGALQGLVCGPDEPPPPPCVPVYPDNAIAECLDGRCTVVILD